eukprot:EC693211.1.p1 GENE.EC693211.1~~EC693211.1.p1  ORF type:complete len:122 (+),score=40.71 EC693211.1:240-605(+)
MYEKYKDRGLVVIGFPCSQFMGQEHQHNEDIKIFVEGKGITFPVMGRIKVNGKEAHPIFQWLKLKLNGSMGNRIKWNFTKFLLDYNGEPVRRVGPFSNPDKLVPDVEILLDKLADHHKPSQ